jgi:hypothetical protein
LSTKPFSRVLWMVFDGMGYEHARRLAESGRHPSLARMAREGHLAATRPSSPVCQTPPALLTLFSGSEPSASGVWGYKMPAPGDPLSTISGFGAPLDTVETLWAALGREGLRSSLMGVAFRHDPVWTDRAPGLAFGYDGYRRWRRPRTIHLASSRTRAEIGGIEVAIERTRAGVVVRRSHATRARLAVGEGLFLTLTPGAHAYLHLLDASTLIVAPTRAAMVRGGGAPASASADFLDFDVFRHVRRLHQRLGNETAITVDAELAPVAVSTRQKADLMVDAIRVGNAELVVGYFPLVDEYNHVYADRLETDWPEGRASRLFDSCGALVDETVTRVFAEADEDTLVVLSSDHGSVAHRSILHINELFADEGLVRRTADGYDLSRSAAFYHPSDSGLVVTRGPVDAPRLLAGIRRVVARAGEDLKVPIGILEPGPGDPFIAFLYPLGDGYFTGDPPGKGRSALAWSKAGGHHLSPLTPNPWINAVLGLWSPRAGADRFDSVPSENSGLKAFLLAALGKG